jgi:hypothetical protein
MNPDECLSVIDDDACNAIYYVNVNFTNVLMLLRMMHVMRSIM